VTGWKRRLAALWAAVVVVAAQAQAGGITSCSEAFVFPGSDVNLVVLPYVLGGADESYTLPHGSSAILESEVGRDLAGLIQLDTLFSLSYPAGMAAIHLVPDGSPCSPTDIREKITPMLMDGKGAVLLWGSVLEDDGDVYVQSYLEFFRKDRTETLSVEVPVLGSKVVLTGAAPQIGLGFPPRILEEDDLRRVHEAAEEARQIWSGSSGGANIATIPTVPESGFAYYVKDVDFESGRMLVEPAEATGLEPGWVQARSDWPLREHLPELSFVDGVIGYLAARVIAEEQQEEHWAGDWTSRFERAQEQAGSAFSAFREATTASEVDSFDARGAIAMSHVLRGMLYMADPRLSSVSEGSSRESLTAAVDEFSQGVEIVPYQSDTRNLLAISLSGIGEVTRAVGELREALSLEPSNVGAKGSLANIYRLLLETGNAHLANLDSADLKTRLSFLE
jgi:hypothetical protein